MSKENKKLKVANPQKGTEKIIGKASKKIMPYRTSLSIKMLYL